MNCIHEEKASEETHQAFGDGVQDSHTSQQNPSQAWRKSDEIGQAERQFTADIRSRRSNVEGSPHHRFFRASSPNDFQSKLANQKAFHNVLQGMEMDTPHPDANFIELPKETLCPFLMRMTVNTFAVPLGLSSQAQLWGALSDSFLMDSALGERVGIPNAIQWFFWTISLVLLFVIGVLYMAKACLYWGAVKREWAHPVRSSFALTPILTAMTLLAGEPRFISDTLHPNTPVPVPAFLVLGGLMLYLQMSLYGKWLFDEDTSLKKANPSYQIAVVGNFLLASLGTQVEGDEGVQLACTETALVFFSVGILYQLMVFMAIQQSSASHIMQSPQKYKKKPSKTKSNSEMPRIDEGHEGGLPAARKGDSGIREKGRRQEVLQNPSRSSPIPLQRPRVGIDVVEKGELALRSRHLEEADGVSDTITMSSFDSNPRFVTTPKESTTKEGPANDQGQRGTEYASKNQKIATSSSRNMSHQTSERLPPSASRPTADPAPQGVLISTKLHPIYFLMVAPPAAASIAWSKLSGEFDKLARSLFFISAFLYMFIAIFNSSFLRNAPFSIAWWAYTFPSSTFALAALRYSEVLGIKGVAQAAFALALLSTLMVLVVFLKTVSAALRGKLFLRDPVVGVCLLHASD